MCKCVGGIMASEKGNVLLSVCFTLSRHVISSICSKRLLLIVSNSYVEGKRFAQLYLLTYVHILDD